MDESTIRGMKLLELKDRESSDADIGEIRICVEGYDNSLRGDELKSALRRHFSSCGTITSIRIPRDFGSDILNRSFITMFGEEDAEKKALELDGSDMGGWNVVVVKPSPYIPELIPELADRAKSSTSYIEESDWMIVTGYDTTLPKNDIKSALIKHFSSYGEITETVKLVSNKKVKVLITGEDAVEKALKLSGCECDVKGCKIVAKDFMPSKRLRRQCTGYTVPVPYIPEAKRAKV